MRPRLLDDVRYIDCPEGAYIESAAGSCVLTGASAYLWLSRLAPHLNGRVTLAGLTENLAQPQRDMVEKIVTQLSDQGFLIDSQTEAPHDLTEEILREYSREIAFIRYSHESAEWRFQQLRSARVLVCGVGPAVMAIAEHGVRTGWRQLRVLSNLEGPSWAGWERHVRRDAGQRIHVELDASALADPTLLAERIEASDLVVHVASDDRTTELERVATCCEGTDVPFSQVLVRAEDVWTMPVRDRRPVPASSGWRWLRAADSTAENVESPWPAEPALSLIAAQVTLGCFRHLTRMGMRGPTSSPDRPRTSSTMTRTDLRNLTTTTHRFHRHPADGVQPPLDAQDARDAIESLRSMSAVSGTDLLSTALPYTDNHVGLFRVLDELDLPQLPLAVATASVVDPYRRGPDRSVVGWGTDQTSARVRTTLSALAVHGRLAVPDTRREWGIDLVSQTMRLVSLDPAPVGPESTVPVGVAAGLRWCTAVEAGLQAHCDRLLTELDGAAGARFDPSESGHEHVRGVTRLLALTGQPHDFRDHTAALGLPAFTVRTGGRTAGWSAAATAEQAISGAAEHALVDWQTRLAGGQVYAPSSRHWALTAGDDDAETRVDVLAHSLRRLTRRTPVAVPLARHGAAASILPFVVAVVLCDD